MQFKSILIASLVSIVSAQDPASVAAFASAAGAYLSSLAADPSFLSQVQGLASADPNILPTLLALQTASINPADLTAAPAFITQLPSPYNSLFGSIYTRERDLASSYGLLPGGSAASVTATGSAASATIASATSVASSGASQLGSAISSAVSSATAANTSAASVAASAASSASSKAAAPTAFPMMGVAAGAVGALAALL